MEKVKNTKPWARIFALGFIFVFVFSVITVDNSWISPNVSEKDSTNVGSEDQSPLSAGITDDPLIGKGNNRSVRVFFNNASTSSGLNEFNISVSSYEEQYIDSGSFNITLGKAFNTTYTLENDSPLTIPMNNTASISNVIEVSATEISGDNASAAADNNLFIGANSTNGNVSYLVTSNFNNLDSIPVNGFRFRIALEVNVTSNISIYAYDILENNWDYYSNTTITAGGKQYFTIDEINYNNRYINSTKYSQFRISIVHNGSNLVNAKLYYLQVNATTGLGYSINNDNKYGLEFDTKGEATIYGFQAWIRAFNITQAGETSNLTFFLYQTNVSTIQYKRSDFVNNGTLVAEPGQLITQNSILNYSGDGPVWFNFSTPASLTIGNYYIVLKSNTSAIGMGKQFQLMTVLVTPVLGGLADALNEHVAIIQEGNNPWKHLQVPGYVFNVDAANFAINLSRGYLPSEINLTIDSKQVLNTYSFEYPADISGPYAQYWWGLGTWSNTFTNKTKASYSNITVKLNWDKDSQNQPANLNITKVSYNATVYGVESIEAYYSVKSSQKVYWNLTFNLEISKYKNWNCTEFWFITPLDWSREYLIAPDTKEYSIVISTDTTSVENMRVFKVKNDTVIGLPNNYQGKYFFNVSSTNYISEVNTYLNYKSNKWAARGFMPGDNVSIDLGIQNYNNKFIPNGTASVALHYANGTAYTYYNLTTTAQKKNDTEKRLTFYDFNEQLIFATNNSVPNGDYYIKSYWSNGDQIGYVVQGIYVGEYIPTIDEVELDYQEGFNRVIGSTSRPNTTLTTTYDLITWVLNKTTDKPEWQYTLNESMITVLNDIETDLFQMNETIANINSTFRVRISAINKNTTLEYDLKYEVILHQYVNREWIITSVNSTTQTLGTLGSGNNRKTWDVDITIPNEGLNAPMRYVPLMISINPIVGNNYDINNRRIVSTPMFLTNLSKNEFTGVAVSSNYQGSRTSSYFLSNIERIHVNTPGNTTYAVQIIDQNFVGQFITPMQESTDKTRGVFRDGNLKTDLIALGRNVTISGTLLDEKNRTLAGIPLKLSYYDGTEWIETVHSAGTSTVLTNANGSFEFTILLNHTVIDRKIKFALNYSGDATKYPMSKELTITLTNYIANITLNLPTKTLFKSKLNIVDLSINNVGNTTCNLRNISIVSDFKVEIVGMNNNSLEYFEPGKVSSIRLKVDVDAFDKPNGTINVTIQMYSIETGTLETIEISQIFTVTRPNIQSYSTAIIMSMVFIGTIGLWIGFVRYAILKRKEAEELISGTQKEGKEDKKKSKPTGKYIDVSELSINKEKEESSKRVVDFDEMVEDEKKE